MQPDHRALLTTSAPLERSNLSLPAAGPIPLLNPTSQTRVRPDIHFFFSARADFPIEPPAIRLFPRRAGPAYDCENPCDGVSMKIGRLSVIILGARSPRMQGKEKNNAVYRYLHSSVTRRIRRCWFYGGFCSPSSRFV